MKSFIVLWLLLQPLALYAQHDGRLPPLANAPADSLIGLLEKEKNDTDKVNLIFFIARRVSLVNPEEALRWTREGMKVAKKCRVRQGEAMFYGEQAEFLCSMSNYPAALEAALSALGIYEQRRSAKDPIDIAVTSVNIANIYSRLNDFPKAHEYIDKAMRLFEELHETGRIYLAFRAAGGLYYREGKYKDALSCYQRMLQIGEQSHDPGSVFEATSCIAIAYAGLGQHNQALLYKFKGLRLSEALGVKDGVATNSGNIGEEYYRIATDTLPIQPDSLIPASREENLAKAIPFLKTGARLYKEMHNLSALLDVGPYLSKALALQGDYKGALVAYQDYAAAKDSIFNQENTTKLARTEAGYEYAHKADSVKAENERRTLLLRKEAQLEALRYEYEKKQAAAKSADERRKLQYDEELKRQEITYEYERRQSALTAEQERKASLAKAAEEKRTALAAAALTREKTKRNAGYLIASLSALLALGAGAAFLQKRKDNRTISKEKQRSDDLLLNILPAEVAEELKQKGASAAKQYDKVSVLFTDFVNFTGTAEHLPPQVLVKELDECFTAFDAIVERNGLEKIKTIGDAYLAVCGLPTSDPRHAHNTVRAALEICDFIEDRKLKERALDIRIGINSGTVVAGIVGVKKFAYDIWGDTVNTAARMEQHGEAGQINISQSTYELVKKEFRCAYRGKVAAKNKGEVEMYFVERALPVAAA